MDDYLPPQLDRAMSSSNLTSEIYSSNTSDTVNVSLRNSTAGAFVWLLPLGVYFGATSQH